MNAYEHPASLKAVSTKTHLLKVKAFFLSADSLHIKQVKVLIKNQPLKRRVVYLEDFFPPLIDNVQYPQQAIVTLKISSHRQDGGVTTKDKKFQVFYQTESTLPQNNWVKANCDQEWKGSILVLCLGKRSIKRDWLRMEDMKDCDVVNWREGDTTYAKRIITELVDRADFEVEGDEPDVPSWFTIFASLP